jgi:hypothetical protein
VTLLTWFHFAEIKNKYISENLMSEAKKGALNLVYFFQNPRISPSQAALASITNMGMGGGIASEVRQILVYK